MTPRVCLHVISILGFCAFAAVAADEPRLTPADVGRAADAAARQQGCDLETYTHGEPSYDPVSKTWGVNYRLRSSKPASAGEGVLSVDINDTTGFVSTRFWLASPTPTPAAERLFSLKIVFFICYVAGGALLAIAPFDRTRTRSRWARATFGIVSVILVFVGASELLRYYGIWTLSHQIEHGFSYTLTSLRGVVAGLLLALAFSGELSGRKLPAEPRPNHAMQRTAPRSDV